MKTVRISEYYDLFDVESTASEGAFTTTHNENLPIANKNTFNTNPFIGFNNSDGAYSSITAADVVQITGKNRAPHANNTLSIDEQGNILCYPPNVGVPYWSRIIFRNFDYSIQYPLGNPIRAALRDDETRITGNITAKMEPLYDGVIIPQTFDLVISQDDIDEHWTSGNVFGKTYTANDLTAGDELTLPLWNVDCPTSYRTKTGNTYPTNFPSQYKYDFSLVQGYEIHNGGITATTNDYTNSPLFLKYDNYPSRSKVVFSGCDKTRNPDIEHVFGYQHGTMEPIKLNLALSASNPLIANVAAPPAATPTYHKYNQNLTRAQIEVILNKCYWCVEWIYEPTSNSDL